MERLSVVALHCPIFRAGQDLAAYVAACVPAEDRRERAIVAVTSKIASLAENRLVPHDSIEKSALVKGEADVWLGETRYGVALTVKENILIPSAGIDESNSETGAYILYPANPFATAQRLWRDLRAAWGVRELGVILTDSHVAPLRRGVTGVALSYWGFRGVRSLVGAPDLFGRELKITQMNVADGLAAAAVFAMGEGAERRPIAVLHGPALEFADVVDPAELRIPLEEDLYGEFFS